MGPPAVFARWYPTVGPNTQRRDVKLLSERGATATHSMEHMPVCSPLRTELTTGRYFNNVKGADSSAKSCMHTTPYPELAANEWLFAPHLRAAGYRVGVFGKWLNNDNPTNAEHGVETWFANGGGNYFNPTFAYDASASNPPGGGKNVQFSNASAPGAAYVNQSSYSPFIHL